MQKIQKKKKKVQFKNIRRQSIKVYRQESRQSQQKKEIGLDMLAKFSRIKKIPTKQNDETNSVKTFTSLRKKEDRQFEATIDNIQPRGSAFVKLGFTAEEKKSNRRLFGDVFNLRYKDLKGTITIADLWSNKDRSNFMKENKIRMNKMKLMEKLTNLKKKQTPINREGQVFKSMRDFKIFTQELLDSCRSFPSMRNTVGKPSSQRNYGQKLGQIKNDLRELKIGEGYKDLRSKVKTLEQCKDKMDQMDRKYFLKLIEMF